MIYENNVFNPTDLDLSRSTFHMTPTTSGTCNAGRLLPIRTFWVQPGDTMKMDVKALIKMSTPVYPTMDALFADVSFFYVPFKLLLSRRYGSPSVNDASESWEAIIGAQDFLLNMPTPANGVKIPVLNLTSNTSYKPGNLMDYFPVYYGVANDKNISALPLLAYFAIWNENYRDPNLMQPVTWSYSTYGGNTVLNPSGMVPIYATREELKYRNSLATDPDYMLCNALGNGKTWTPNSPDTVNTADVWLPFPVCRFHGFFGSCLPWPQRNIDGVTLPLGNSAPIVDSGTFHDIFSGTPGSLFDSAAHESGARTWFNALFERNTGSQGGLIFKFDDASMTPSGNDLEVTKTTLVADLKNATAANVNALRASIQLQRWYEKLARSGNRYDEFEYGVFGVRPHDSGDNKPLYLGGKRIPLAIEMVASTNGDTSASSGEGAGSLGALGAFSHTNDSDGYFYHSFDDWGVVMCVVCIRHHDTFASGTDPFWLKRTRDDLYFPTFAHLGEQVEGDHLLIDKANDGTVFGYQPAWTEYRNEVDRVHGLLRPGQSLDFMTYARSFGSGTTLGEFLNASSQVATVDQTLAVSSNAAGFQFVYQFTFDLTWRRAMPTDSIPGLMDHF